MHRTRPAARRSGSSSLWSPSFGSVCGTLRRGAVASSATTAACDCGDRLPSVGMIDRPARAGRAPPSRGGSHTRHVRRRCAGVVTGRSTPARCAGVDRDRWSDPAAVLEHDVEADAAHHHLTGPWHEWSNRLLRWGGSPPRAACWPLAYVTVRLRGVMDTSLY